MRLPVYHFDMPATPDGAAFVDYERELDGVMT